MRIASFAGWWKNVVLFICSSGLAVILAEGLVATFIPQNLGSWAMTRDGLTSHVPNLSVYLPKFRQEIRINSYGMRDREHSLSKDPGTFRILVLGDSFMEANQVAFEQSFAALLESELNSKVSRKVEVVNAAVSGWGTDDELTYFIRYGVQFYPDLVLLGMTLHNDIQDNLEEEFHSFVDEELYEKPIAYISDLDWAQLQVKEFLASHLHLYQIFLHVYHGGWRKGEANRLNDHLLGLLRREQTSSIGRGWEMTQQLFEKLKAKSEEIGAQTAIFLIPLWIQVSDRKLEEFLSLHNTTKEQIILDRPQQEMKRIGAEEDLLILDLLETFAANERANPDRLYLEDDGHWTSDGHRLGAKFVAGKILASGIVK